MAIANDDRDGGGGGGDDDEKRDVSEAYFLSFSLSIHSSLLLLLLCNAH